jgi:hypothetical protein
MPVFISAQFKNLSLYLSAEDYTTTIFTMMESKIGEANSHEQNFAQTENDDLTFPSGN